MIGRPLRITSFLAANANGLFATVTERLAKRLGVQLEFVPQPDSRAIDAAFMCGFAYVERVSSGQVLSPCAAPVFAGPRYGDEPCYFADVVVHRDSEFHAFVDLRGAAWTYNEAHSHSGFNIVASHLSSLGHRSGFFGSAVATGAHKISLERVFARDVDATSLDSSFLDMECHRRPELEALRVISSLGPEPAPPFVVFDGVPPELRRALTREICRLGDLGWISRFVAIQDSDYDAVRATARRAKGVSLTGVPSGTRPSGPHRSK